VKAISSAAVNRDAVVARIKAKLGLK
jgi:hypothetical protein